MLKEKKDVCFACIASNKSTTCVHETNQKASTDKLVERALKMLSSTNFSPPFNAVTPNLYIGDLRSFFQPPAECTHVVSLVEVEISSPQNDARRHLFIKVRDDPETDIKRVLEEISSFGSGEKDVVLVHCIEGRSRSAAVVIGLLMKRQNRSFDEAFAEVKKARPRLAPLPQFVAQLKCL